MQHNTSWKDRWRATWAAPAKKKEELPSQQLRSSRPQGPGTHRPRLPKVRGDAQNEPRVTQMFVAICQATVHLFEPNTTSFPPLAWIGGLVIEEAASHSPSTKHQFKGGCNHKLQELATARLCQQAVQAAGQNINMMKHIESEALNFQSHAGGFRKQKQQQTI